MILTAALTAAVTNFETPQHMLSQGVSLQGWWAELARRPLNVCKANQRSATESECLPAAKAAVAYAGIGGAKTTVQSIVQSVVIPPGCSYSHFSKTAVYNRNPKGNCSKGAACPYDLVCVAEGATQAPWWVGLRGTTLAPATACASHLRAATESECTSAKGALGFKSIDSAVVPSGCSYSHASKGILFNWHLAGAWASPEASPYELICVEDKDATPSPSPSPSPSPRRPRHAAEPTAHGTASAALVGSQPLAQATACAANQHVATERECTAVMRSAGGALGIKVINTKHVPSGCSYSYTSKAMVFNGHPSGVWSSPGASPYELFCVADEEDEEEDEEDEEDEAAAAAEEEDKPSRGSASAQAASISRASRFYQASRDAARLSSETALGTAPPGLRRSATSQSYHLVLAASGLAPASGLSRAPAVLGETEMPPGAAAADVLEQHVHAIAPPHAGPHAGPASSKRVSLQGWGAELARRPLAVCLADLALAQPLALASL